MDEVLGELAVGLLPPLDWPDMFEPGISDPGISDPGTSEPVNLESADAAATNGASGASDADTRPSAELKCPEIRVWRLAEIESEATEWLSPDRFPLGTLTVLAGASGVGKTFLALDLAAHVTRGAAWPRVCGPGEVGEECSDKSPQSKGSVVVMNAKDSATTVLRPRLDAAGAEVERVTVVSPAKQLPLLAATRSNPGTVARRLNALQAAIIDAGDCRLAVVDDLDAWMGEFGFSSPALHVCAFLDQLAAIAARTQTAIVCLARLNASPEGRVAYRELTNPLKSAQVVWLVADDHEQPGRKLLLPVKNNLAPSTPALGFRLAPAASGCAVVVWEDEPLGMTAAEVMAPGAGWVERRRERDGVAQWLMTALADGRLASNDLFREAAECGIAMKTLRRAAAQLGIKPSKTSFQGGWFWSAAPDIAEDGQLERQSSCPAARQGVEATGPTEHEAIRGEEADGSWEETIGILTNSATRDEDGHFDRKSSDTTPATGCGTRKRAKSSIESAKNGVGGRQAFLRVERNSFRLPPCNGMNSVSRLVTE